MATWEDGPEYAPLQRPQYYADAPLPPLEQAPTVARPIDIPPTARPGFDEPAQPVAPLATLVPEPPDERDPRHPFDIVTTTLTSQSSWGSSPAPAPADGPPATTTPLGMLVPTPDPYAYPAPGTPGWFAPPPAPYGEQQQPGRVDVKQVVEAATPGLCICLALGGLVQVLAPILLVVAVFLSTRVLVAQRAVRIAFRSAAGAVAFFAVVGLVRSVFVGAPWWSFVGLWSLLSCWVMLGVLLLLVRQALTRPTAPPTTNPWG